MKSVAWDAENKKAISPQRKPKAGEYGKFTYDSGPINWEIKQYSPSPILTDEDICISVEREWRDSELVKTDGAKMPDYPQNLMDALLAYREKLRDYPQQSDFPNGERPKL